MKRRIDSKKKPENVNVLFYSTLLNNDEGLSSLPGRSSCPLALASAVHVSGNHVSRNFQMGGIYSIPLATATGGAFIVVGRFFFWSAINYTAVESIMQRPSRLVSALPIGSGTLVVPSIHPP